MRHCDECAARLGAAEETVSRLLVAEREPSAQLDRRMISSFRNPWANPLRSLYPLRSFYPLLAATLLIAFVPLTIFGLKYRDAVEFQTQQAAATHAMVNSHFVHAPFVPLTADAPHAKVISARDGSWFYVLADTNKPLSVAVETNGTRKPLGTFRVIGTLRVSGNEGSLFVVNPPKGVVILLDGPRLLARAHR